ncbi:hypothetical protein A6R68_06941, partial [Neotoma lepida]
MKTGGRCSLVDTFEEATLKKMGHIGKKECFRLNPPHYMPTTSTSVERKMMKDIKSNLNSTFLFRHSRCNLWSSYR